MGRSIGEGHLVRAQPCTCLNGPGGHDPGFGKPPLRPMISGELNIHSMVEMEVDRAPQVVGAIPRAAVFLSGHTGHAWASTDFFRSASRSSASDPNDLTAGGVLEQQVELAR